MINMLRNRLSFWRNPFSNSELKSDAVAGRLGVAIFSRIRQDHGLDARLKILAEVLTDLPEVSGAIVVGFDDGNAPRAYGESNLSIHNGSRGLAELETIRATLSKETWADVPIHQIEALGAHVVRGRSVADRGTNLGMILIGLSDDTNTTFLLDGIEKALTHFRWAIQDVSRLEEMRLIKRMRKLELDESGRLKTIQPQEVAERLKKIYCANAVTILVREQGRLYLSATTDAELKKRAKHGKRVVAYDPGEGFTGFILDTGTPIRLRNARDGDEIRDLYPYPELNKRGTVSQHPEELAKPGGRPFRFLAVPMRSGIRGGPISNGRAEEVQLKTRGVIRILRTETDPPFSDAEHDALQHFADILSIAMHSSWRIHLADHLIKGEAEAICITRNEPGKGHVIPRVVYADPGAEKLFGLENDNMNGMDARNLYADGEYERINVFLDKAIAKNRDVCGPIKTKVKHFDKAGDFEIRSVDISYRLIASLFVQPMTRYTIAVIRDITESQIQAEQHDRLVNLLDKKGLAYFRSDKGGLTIETSPTEMRLTGYSFEELRGMHRDALYAEPSDQRWMIKRVIKRDGQLLHVIQRLKHKNGELFIIEGVMSALKGDDGQWIGYEGLYENITERIRLQGFLDVDTENILREGELYQKLKEETEFHLLFMTSVSHQLRSPLGALVEQLLNFQEGVVDSSHFSNRLKYAIGQARVSALLVSNLTYMDKILRGESFDFRPVNFAKLAIETKINFDHLLHDKRLRIYIYEKSIKRHLNVHGHQELLRQIFVNLIDNAIKYSSRRSWIRLRGCEGPQGRFFQITNRGLAVPREYRAQIFDRGFRMPQAQALVPAGTGLGLWLVKKIVEAHGATVRCTEVLEEGEERTAFQIFFPNQPIRRSIDTRRLT